MKNKYATGVLVCTIIAIIIFVAPLVFALPAVKTLKEISFYSAYDISQEAIDSAINLVATIIVMLLIVGIFAVISGFLLSLKGKWGVGCIVFAFILAALEGYSFLSSLGGNSSGLLLPMGNTINFVVMGIMAIKCRNESMYI